MNKAPARKPKRRFPLSFYLAGVLRSLHQDGRYIPYHHTPAPACDYNPPSSQCHSTCALSLAGKSRNAVVGSRQYLRSRRHCSGEPPVVPDRITLESSATTPLLPPYQKGRRQHRKMRKADSDSPSTRHIYETFRRKFARNWGENQTCERNLFAMVRHITPTSASSTSFSKRFKWL